MTAIPLLKHRHLFLQLVKRELAARYRNSLFGGIWAIVTPLLMLAVYTFVFCEIFGLRWTPASDANRAEFALHLFAGMVVYGFFAECLGNSSMIVVTHVNYVKKVVFPLELLTLSSMCASLVHALGAVLVLIACRALILGGVPLTSLLVLPVLFPLLLQVAGLGWFLAALGVYARDVNQVLGIVLSGLMFLSPVFYPASRIPEQWRFLFSLNPLTVPIEQTREVLILGQTPVFADTLPGLLAGTVVALAGYAWFQKTRSGFADVL